ATMSADPSAASRRPGAAPRLCAGRAFRRFPSPCLRRQCCERAGSGAAVPPTPCTGRRQTALAQDEAQEAAHPSPVPHALGSRSAPISVTMVRSTSNGSAGASGAAVAADAPVVAVMIGLSMVAVIALPLLSEGSERFVVPPGLRMDCRRAGFL